MTYTHPPAPQSSYFRLSPKTWREIKAAYMAGATAKQVAARWQISVSTLYRRASDEKWSKTKNGDIASRAHAASAHLLERIETTRAEASAPPPETPSSLHSVRRRAVSEMERLTALGRFGEAQAAAKLVEILVRTIEAERIADNRTPHRGMKPKDFAANSDAAKQVARETFDHVARIAGTAEPEGISLAMMLWGIDWFRDMAPEFGPDWAWDSAAATAGAAAQAAGFPAMGAGQEAEARAYLASLEDDWDNPRKREAEEPPDAATETEDEGGA